MSAILTVLASGSSANGYIIKADNEVLILEAGVPFKECAKVLNYNLEGIRGVCVSHAHRPRPFSIHQTIPTARLDRIF